MKLYIIINILNTLTNKIRLRFKIILAYNIINCKNEKHVENIKEKINENYSTQKKQIIVKTNKIDENNLNIEVGL